MATPINTIYSWFETGDFPTQAQFQASWSSFWHKDEKLPMSSIEGLSAEFGKYILVSTFNTHLTDENAHPYFAKKDASNIEGANVDNWRTALQIEDLQVGFSADGTLANGLYVPLEKVAALSFSALDFEYEIGEETDTVLIKKKDIGGVITETSNTVAFTGDGTIANPLRAETAGIPQVNSDWNATEGVAKILNKPTIPTIVPVSATVSGIVNNTALQELGGVDKLIQGVRVGKGAGNTAAVKVDSTALGVDTLTLNTTGSNNTALGTSVLANNTTGKFNAAAGDYSLWSNTTGQWNVALGSATLLYNTTGSRNIAVGTSLYWNTTGNSNTAIGINAGYQGSTGSFNTYVGEKAGYNNGIGNYNVAIGSSALIISGGGATGNNTVNINNNVFIGAGLRTAAGMNDTLAIDNKGGTITDAANALIYGGFSVANRFVKINGVLSVNPANLATADSTYTKNIVAKADGTFGWEDRVSVPKPPVSGNFVLKSSNGVMTWVEEIQ